MVESGGGGAGQAQAMAAEPDSAPVGVFMERQIGHLLRRAYVRARANSAEALAALGDVSPVQASALAALAGGALTQAELGRRIDMEPANVHGLVRRLKEAGYAERVGDPANRRLALVRLTAAGAALAAELEPVLARSAAATLAPLANAEREQLLGYLQRLVALRGG